MTTKTKPHGRVDDPFIAEKFIAEKEKIFRWMFDGLQRLIQHGFRFTISQKTQMNIADALTDNCNIIEFLQDDKVIVRGNNCKTTGSELYAVYCQWCEENAMTALKRDTFISYLKKNQDKFDIA